MSVEKIDDDSQGQNELPEQTTFTYSRVTLVLLSIIMLLPIYAAVRLEITLMLRYEWFVFQLMATLCIAGLGALLWHYIACMRQIGQPIITISNSGISYSGKEFPYKKECISWSEIRLLEYAASKGGASIIINFNNQNGKRKWVGMPITYLRNSTQVFPCATAYFNKYTRAAKAP
ncbi:MAG: hypothetical protein WBD81_17740 [Collimonas pratensis]|uniref:hypothetical protein n=1 Tax=Collimonas pratensis TaxID=279113 RepID=UPI003C724C23